MPISLKANSDGSAEILNGANKVLDISQDGWLGGKNIQGYNYIINGNFDIWQRGTGQTTNGYGSDDRWKNVNGGSTKTVSRQSFSVGEQFSSGQPTPTYFSRTAVSSVVGDANFVAKQQFIEGVSALAGKKATISLWAKADSGKNIAIEFIQNFGTGGSPSSVVTGIGTRKLALTAVWQRFVVTVDIPSINGKVLGTDGNSYLGLNIWLDAGANVNSRTDNLGHQSGTFDIACVSLVEGDVDVKPIPRSIGEELALCKRYCQKAEGTMWSYQSVGMEMGYLVLFPTPMRAVPLVTHLDGDATFVALANDRGRMYKVVGSTGAHYQGAVVQLDAEL